MMSALWTARIGGLAFVVGGLALASTPAPSVCEDIETSLLELFDDDVSIAGESKVTLTDDGCRLEIDGLELVEGSLTYSSGPMWLEASPSEVVGEPVMALTWVLPEKVVASDGAGETKEVMSLGSQSWSALVHEESDQVLGLDVDLASLSFDVEGEGTGSLDKLTVRSGIAATAEDPEKLDWNTRLEISGVTADHDEEGGFALQRLVGSNDVLGLPLGALGPLLKAGAALREQAEEGDPDDAGLTYARKLAALWVAYDGLFGEARIGYRLTGLDAQQEEGPPLLIQDAAISSKAVSGDGQTLTTDFDLGFVMEPGQEVEGETEALPEEGHVRAVLSGMPANALMQGLVALDPEVDPSFALLALGQGLLGAALEAGTKLEVPSLWATSPLYSAEAEGELEMSPEASLLAIGGADIEIENLPAIVDLLKGQPDAEESAVLRVLTLVQALGQQSEAEGGRPLHSYRIELDQEGRATLNGTDLMPLLGAVNP